VPLHPLTGLQPYQAREVAYALGFKGKQINQAVKIMMKLAKLYTDKDCSIAEINPLIVTPPTTDNPDGQVLAIDAKFNFDDNALFRHKDIAPWPTRPKRTPPSVEAKNFGLSYIALDGNIGCLVNGAGLAMATMDIIKLHGGEPANFLDVGGGASEEPSPRPSASSSPTRRVKGIMVNIFGGIMRCDIIAQGIVNAPRRSASRCRWSFASKAPMSARRSPDRRRDAARRALPR
jgi:succinyl-CoA synthetase beta subunit